MAASPDRSQPAPRAAALVRILDTTSPFSPNGDGHHDRVAVRYRLKGEARVSVEVERSGKTVFRTAPKTTRPGTRTFRWDGTRTSGRQVADGRYRVVVRAAAHGTSRTDCDRGRRPDDADTAERRHHQAQQHHCVPVHRRSSTMSSSATSAYRRPSNGDCDARRRRVIEASRAQVLDRSGRVIATEPVTCMARMIANDYQGRRCDPCGRFTWDGRDSDGVRLAPGAYRIRVVQGRDAAGNVRILSDTRTVRVSRAQLELKTTVVDLTPATTRQTVQPENGCNGCPYYECRGHRLHPVPRRPELHGATAACLRPSGTSRPRSPVGARRTTGSA